MPESRIERFDPAFDKIIDVSETIHDLADGFGGAQGPAEGPVWWKEGGYLLFSDIHNNKRMKFEPGKGVSLFLDGTNRANGLTRDLQGRLIACEHDSRRVTRLERVLHVSGESLGYELRMATGGDPAQPHLRAVLHRARALSAPE